MTMRFLRDPAIAVSLCVLLAIALGCALAPFYAAHVAQTDPFSSAIDATVALHGASRPVLAENTAGLGLGVTPIGPTWQGRYLLGADAQGRDVAARLLYGGRNSLLISAGATAICLVLAGLIGTLAGFFGGMIDAVLSRALDVLWAFPVMLLAISLSLVLVSQDLRIGPLRIASNSLLLPVMILGIVYVPYVARPVRAEVIRLRAMEFVRAAGALGVPPRDVLIRHISPFVFGLLATFAPLVMALSLLTESALSFLSIGVQAPAASWGTLIGDGQTLIYARPMVAVAPGLAIVATVLALNVLGDALRDARDKAREGAR